MAEREGFEPPCRLPGKTLSRRPRYDHFGTSPLITSLDGPSYIPHLAARSRSPAATALRRSLAAAGALYFAITLLGVYDPQKIAASIPGIQPRARRQ